MANWFKEAGEWVAGKTLNAIEGLADWVGLGQDFKDLTRGGKRIDPVKLVNRIVAKALAQNQMDIDQLQDKLDALPIDVPASIKSQIQNKRRQLRDELNKKKTDRIIAETKVGEAEQYANLAAEARSGDIKREREDLGKAKDAANTALSYLGFDPNKKITGSDKDDGLLSYERKI